MSARDDYATLANITVFDKHLESDLYLIFDEIDRLRRWKAEAIEVLQHWDAVAVRFNLSGHLGEFTADAVGAEIDDLHRRLAEASPDPTSSR